jgi:hypothetical protein
MEDSMPIRGQGCTRYSVLVTQTRSIPDAVRALTRAWNRLDVGEVESSFTDDVSYVAPAVGLSLGGRTEVLGYLRRKMDLIAQVGDDGKIEARVATLARASGDVWCLVSTQGDVERAAVFILELDRSGQIARVEVSTDPEDRAAAEVL